MKSLAALAAAVMLAAPSTPEPPKWSSAIPPERFQAHGLVPVLFIPPEDIATACSTVGEPPEGLIIVACTVTLDNGARLVIMPDACAFAGEFYAGVMCHEAAHFLSDWRHETE